MAWTKTQTAIITGVIVLLAVGTTTVTVKEMHPYKDSEWDIGQVNGNILQTAPHIVKIIPAKFPKQGGLAGTGNGRALGLGLRVEEIAGFAYGDIIGTRTIFLTDLPSEKYDFISNLRFGSETALRREIEKQFGIVGRYETVETNVLYLRIQSPNALGLRPAATRNSSSSSENAGEYHVVNLRFFNIRDFVEGELGIPVIDQTGLTGSYDIDLKWDSRNDPQHENLKLALQQQLGLELIPGIEPIKMLVIKKTK
jgi:hypothetical protein